QRGQMTVNIYSLPGWLYQTIYLGLTLGLEGTRVKLPGLRQLGLQRGQTILDWGCGTGLLLGDIADELQAGTIIAKDRSPGLLRQAISKRLPRFEGVAGSLSATVARACAFPRRLTQLSHHIPSES